MGSCEQPPRSEWQLYLTERLMGLKRGLNSPSLLKGGVYFRGDFGKSKVLYAVDDSSDVVCKEELRQLETWGVFL